MKITVKENDVAQFTADAVGVPTSIAAVQTAQTDLLRRLSKAGKYSIEIEVSDDDAKAAADRRATIEARRPTAAAAAPTATPATTK